MLLKSGTARQCMGRGEGAEDSQIKANTNRSSKIFETAFRMGVATQLNLRAWAFFFAESPIAGDAS